MLFVCRPETGWGRVCVSPRLRSIALPPLYRDSQIALPLAGSLTAPETERGKKWTARSANEREREQRRKRDRCLSVAEIWEVVEVRQLSVQIQTQGLAGVWVWVRVRAVTRSRPDHGGLRRKFDQPGYTDRLQAIYLTARRYRSVLLLARQETDPPPDRTPGWMLKHVTNISVSCVWEYA